MAAEAWSATGVLEAPLERVVDVLLSVAEGPIGTENAPLLRALPGAGRLMGRATLRGGPMKYTIHYGHDPGGTVEIDRDRGYFSFRGGYKFGADYHFTPHPKGTLLTYRAFNVAPERHRNRAIVRFQFWLGAKPKIGLRGGLRHMSRTLGCRAYPAT